MTRFLNRILRLPLAGAAFLSRVSVFVLVLYFAGIGFIVNGIWQGSEPWGKAALGIACLVTAAILARMRR